MQLLSLVMFLLLLLSLSFNLALPVFSDEFKEEWKLWQAEHGRNYHDTNEELERLSIWKSNKVYIEEHNRYSDVFGFSLKMNRFGDMTSLEFFESTSNIERETESDMNKVGRRHLHNYPNDNDQPKHHHCHGNTNHSWPHIWSTREGFFHLPKSFNMTDLPNSVDWRSEGAVTPVKDQGFCKSAYAFSVTGAIEGAYAVSTGKLEPLSEQNIIDCSVVYGNKGCNGGNREATIMYILDNDGIDTAKSYPYLSSQEMCKFRVDTVGATVRGLVRIKKGSVRDLQAAVALVGPVTIAIDHQHAAFRFYSYGVFDTRNCSNKKLTHEMLVVGYGKESGKNYWILKNSWGPSWGLDGYMKMIRRNHNQCGLATKAIFPKL